LTGLVLAAPLAITIYVIRWMVLWIDGWVKPLIPDSYNPDTYLPFPVPGFGAIIAFVFITLLGFLTANLIGRRLVLYGETVLGRMPLVRTIYGGLKQIFETVLSNRAASFQEVVLIEYPRRGLWAIAFVATTTKGEVRQKLAAREQDDDEIVSVFMPTTPNPTSGFLLFVKRGEIIELDMTVEEAAKLVISAGLVTPEEKDRLVARRKRRPQLQPQREPAAGGQ
jgi:uncharacterized membrane protein